MGPGDEFELELGAIAHGGASIGRHEGRVVFVRHGIPGERVRVRVEEMGPRGRFATARLLEVLEPSPSRRPHTWPAADALLCEDPVGGVEYGHMEPAAQRELKAEVLREQLTRLGGLAGHDPAVRGLEVLPAPGDEEGAAGWRTRVHFAVDESGRLGMHPHHGSAILPVEEFPLAVPAINGLGLWRGRWPGAERIDVAAPADGGRPLLVFTTRPDVEVPATARELDEELGRILPTGADVSAVVRQAAVPGRGRGDRPDPVTLRGQARVEETVPDVVAGPAAPRLGFRVGAGGFWQIHRAAPELLAAEVAAASGLRAGETAWDLYGGAGLFAAVLASQVGAEGSVWTVEGSPVTSADAAENLRPGGTARGAASAGARILATRAGVERALAAHAGGRAGGRAGAAASGASSRRRGRGHGRGAPVETLPGRPDVVVLDPPRQGAGREAIEAIAACGARRIVYVACDPAALGRDAGYLRGLGWAPRSVRGLDLYPGTHHLEAVAVFEAER
ncbi:class I SAM-dependent RNA methyltransferase [Rothia halotolerans]|uniref:class I SAM-dependent RNA methyltransferase n=1 Tax=Rothia halotolerans TaxID=405770 RepID=UPI00101DB710|nr:TRAM domain-containing protein [Rothia halotolerans]